MSSLSAWGPNYLLPNIYLFLSSVELLYNLTWIFSSWNRNFISSYPWPRNSVKPLFLKKTGHACFFLSPFFPEFSVRWTHEAEASALVPWWGLGVRECLGPEGSEPVGTGQLELRGWAAAGGLGWPGALASGHWVCGECGGSGQAAEDATRGQRVGTTKEKNSFWEKSFSNGK